MSWLIKAPLGLAFVAWMVWEAHRYYGVEHHPGYRFPLVVETADGGAL